MAEVILQNVRKVYPNGVVAVEDATLAIHDRELLVLVGPSGCGKTTMLRLIAGLEEVTGGEIFIGDRCVNAVPAKDRDVAMVFQSYALYPHMTVYGNMAFGLRLRGFARAEIDRRVQEAARILGIAPLLDRKPRSLSGGERQRVAVGRAIVRKPQAFLFDEPLSNLDANMRVQMRTELTKLHGRLRATMIFVTHDQVEALTMGDRIVVMHQGAVQQIAEPMQLYDHPANRFVAGFIGSPPMNFFEGRLEANGGDLFFQEGGFRIRVPRAARESLAPFLDRPVTFGLRPEDVFDPRVHGHRAEGPTETDTLTARVDLIEPMGHESFMYLSAGRSNFTARLDPRVRAEIDDRKTLTLDLSKVRFFDAETGRAIVERASRP